MLLVSTGWREIVRVTPCFFDDQALTVACRAPNMGHCRSQRLCFSIQLSRSCYLLLRHLIFNTSIALFADTNVTPYSRLRFPSSSSMASHHRRRGKYWSHSFCQLDVKDVLEKAVSTRLSLHLFPLIIISILASNGYAIKFRFCLST
jgi:hypothetical protein